VSYGKGRLMSIKNVGLWHKPSIPARQLKSVNGLKAGRQTGPRRRSSGTVDGSPYFVLIDAGLGKPVGMTL